jgi:hypothetical protein
MMRSQPYRLAGTGQGETGDSVSVMWMPPFPLKAREHDRLAGRGQGLIEAATGRQYQSTDGARMRHAASRPARTDD